MRGCHREHKLSSLSTHSREPLGLGRCRSVVSAKQAKLSKIKEGGDQGAEEEEEEDEE